MPVDVNAIAYAVAEILKASGQDVEGVDGLNRRLKDSMPATGRPTSGYIYEGNSPFNLLDDSPIVTAVPYSSKLMNAIPRETMDARYETISHLEWVAPKGFDGSQSYRSFLADVDIDECGYGPSTSWNGFSYRQSGGTFSFSTDMMKPITDGGLPYHRRQPIYSARGDSSGMVALENDREWAIARLLMVAQEHADYVLKYGDKSNSDMEWDGRSQVIRPGYVQARLDGPGNPTWADPLVINALAINNPKSLLRAIRVAYRRIRDRIRMRRWRYSQGDIFITMGHKTWDILSEHIAWGAMYEGATIGNTYGFAGDLSMRDFQEEYQRVRAGGEMFDGFIPIDGSELLPVIADDAFESSAVIDEGGENEADAVVGDIQINTVRLPGVGNILAQKYLQWDQLTYPAEDETYISFPGTDGQFRAGWVKEANKCYYYYLEMGGSFISRMNPLQCVIPNVTLAILPYDQVESGAFYSPNFYPYGETRGHAGSALLTPSN